MNLISRRRFFCTPGESVFDSILNLFLGASKDEGNRGAVYSDPQADEPYLFYLAGVSVVRHIDDRPRVLDEVLVGVKQFSDGRCEQTPVHLLLTLTPESPNRSPISSEWIDLADDVHPIKTFVVKNFGTPKLTGIRDELQSQLANKRLQLRISFNSRKSELLTQRPRLQADVIRGVPAAQSRLNNCEQELDALSAKHEAAEARLIAEIENTQLGHVTIHTRAFVTPHPEIPTRTMRDTEAVALRTVIEYERAHGAEVVDVSNPHLKKGFDLESKRPDGEVRYIEVKGRTGIANVE